MTVRRCPLSRSLSGVKQTSSAALRMSAFDPKRTSNPVLELSYMGRANSIARLSHMGRDVRDPVWFANLAADTGRTSKFAMVLHIQKMRFDGGIDGRDLSQ